MDREQINIAAIPETQTALKSPNAVSGGGDEIILTKKTSAFGKNN